MYHVNCFLSLATWGRNVKKICWGAIAAQEWDDVSREAHCRDTPSLLLMRAIAIRPPRVAVSKAKCDNMTELKSHESTRDRR